VRRLLSIAVFVLGLGLVVGCLYNVFSDNAAVQTDAGEVFCQGHASGCKAQLVRLERTPFGQTFDFSDGKSTGRVTCRRSLVFVGDYSCAR
jgi:hypothetical protein